MTVAVPEEPDAGAVQGALDRILAWGVDGFGPLKGAQQIAEQHLTQHGDPDKAIDKLIATHTRLVAATGFATGVGGVLVLPITIPADVAAFYAMSARCAAGVAYLRGYDLRSDEVRSVVLLTLLGSAGAAVAAEAGIKIGTKSAIAALRRLPGRVLIEINKKVGFRLFTKFGSKGVVNLVKVLPLVGGGVGAGVNVAAMRGVGVYAKKNFPEAVPTPA